MDNMYKEGKLTKRSKAAENPEIARMKDMLKRIGSDAMTNFPVDS